MNFILGTAGHIDHGKSSLIQALTGTHPDRLPEEKERGVTIELGFAHLSLTAENHKELEVGVVDVPGHADFVNNMVAGVGALDLALFVVAADDGWMPQSEEHLHILTYLGVTNAIIAMTKADLAEDIAFSAEFIRDSLRGTAFAESPIIPVSSKTGHGLDELRAAIAATLSESPAHDNLGTPFLPIDRAFSVKGMGTIVTGTLSRGSLAVGDKVLLQPTSLPAHVRSIQNHNRAVKIAHPGMRTAVNIPDSPLDSRKLAGVKRGLILTTEATGSPSDTLDVWITRLERPIPAQPTTKKPLKNNQKVRIHYGSGRTHGRIRLLDGEIPPGGKGLAQIRLEAPLLALAADRLVLRDWSGEATLAGALIIDPTASRRLFGKKDHQNRLKKLANDPSPRNFLAHAFHTHRFLSARPSPQSFPFSNRLFKNALKELLSEQIIVKTTSGYALADWWLELIEISTSLISDYHKKNPDLPGLPLQDLRNALARPLKGHELFDEVIAALASEDIGQQREVLCAASHRTDIPPELAKEAETILSALQSGKLNPPTRKDLTPTPSSQRTLAFLVRTQQVLSLDNKTILHPTALDTACQLIRQHLEKNGRATASELRQVLNTSRRVCMPLLEHLDNIGLTQRKGDFRELL